MKISIGDTVRVIYNPPGVPFDLRGTGAVVEEFVDKHVLIAGLDGSGERGSGAVPLHCLELDNSPSLKSLAKKRAEEIERNTKLYEKLKSEKDAALERVAIGANLSVKKVIEVIRAYSKEMEEYNI